MSAEALWPFALDTYGRPGVETAMLAAQDRHGQCVAYLLWVLWLGETGRGLDPQTLSSGASIASAWQGAALAPLRDLRRRLKAPGPAPQAARERLRASVKRLELDAERMLLEILEAASPPAGAPPAGPGVCLESAASAWGATLPQACIHDMVKLLR